MKLSPGMELVWNIAAHETVGAHMKEIEPEHFFMAVLKFSEIGEEPLKALAPSDEALYDMRSDRDRLRQILTARSIPSTRFRRQLRAIVGRGDYQHQGEVVHRSSASRVLFERAVGLVGSGQGSLRPQHLLQALLAEPSDAVHQAAEALGIALDEQERFELSGLLDAYAGPLPPPRKQADGRADQVIACQGRALAAALQTSGVSSLLLICDSGVDPRAVVYRAAELVDGTEQLLAVNGAGLLSDKDETLLPEVFAELVDEARGLDGVHLFFDGVQLQPWETSLLTNGLSPLLADAAHRVVLAVPVDIYEGLLEEEAGAWGHVRRIWLHLWSEQASDTLTGLSQEAILTPRAHQLLMKARELALHQQVSEIGVDALLEAARASGMIRGLLGKALGQEIAPCRDGSNSDGLGTLEARPVAASAELGDLVGAAESLALEVADWRHPGWIGVRHVAAALAMSSQVARWLGTEAVSRSKALALLQQWYEGDRTVSALGMLTGRLRRMRDALLDKIVGQDHAIHAFTEGLFNAQFVAAGDRRRKGPRAVFVFAGPPGVGKTMLAESGAELLELPFRRFDMSGFSDHQQHMQLVGFAPSYRGAQPGSLTGFVAENPECVILFDEIEKAHLNTVQLFLQILDAGRLEDKYTGEEVAFRETVVIFTTNAGASLYDRPNATGISTANDTFHRRTILDALRGEKDSAGRQIFPEAICSRLATGYPILFNHLGVNELEFIGRKELERVERLVEEQYYKPVTHDDAVPMALVLREGAQTDARTVVSQCRSFVQTELYNYFRLYREGRLATALDEIEGLHFMVEVEEEEDGGVADLFGRTEHPTILLIGSEVMANLLGDQVPEVQWLWADSAEDVMQMLAREEVDMVLLDIWMGQNPAHLRGTLSSTVRDFDFVPVGANALAEGQTCLRAIHERLPSMPVFLLSLAYGGQGEETVSEELFLACVRAGGARGIISRPFSAQGLGDNTVLREGLVRDDFVEELRDTATRMHREKRAEELGMQRKVLAFDTAPSVDRETGRVLIRLRNLRLARAVGAEDASELLEEVERPSTRFADVYGAGAAKEALSFVVDWLRNPKRYAALGVRPPRGILLSGPPGTGKTMLARAVAGETDAAFMVASATEFVTIWQGSGPQNVRDLFARARRYAPSIVFVDEIDAIGKRRMGGGGSARAEEGTLNALLTEMDGFGGPTTRPVIMLAASNLAEQLDRALLRRFDRVIEVPPPDREAREAYLQHELLDREHSQVRAETVENLARRSAGMTIADLHRVVDSAAVLAARRNSGLTDETVLEAYERATMGDEQKTPDPETLERIARHEAGHALVGWLCGMNPLQVTIVGRGSAGGYVQRDVDEDKIIYTRRELDDIVCQSMGGRAAEIIYYGEEEGLSTGVASDLRQASQWAERMIREYGMSEQVGQIYLGGNRNGEAFSDQVVASCEQIVAAQLRRGTDLLRDHRAQLDRLAEELLAKNRLTGEQVADLLEAP